MKIAVCFKAVPDFDQVVQADWDSFSLASAWTYVKRVFGCFDESALETALRLRSAWGESGEAVECTALTAAPLPSPLCKTLFAAGFDRVLDLSGIVSERRPQITGGSLPPASAGYKSPASASLSAGESPRNAPLPPAGAGMLTTGELSHEFRPRHIAAILGNYLGPAAYDLILTGRQTGYADTGTIPLFLAEFLGIPVLTGAEELTPCAGGLEVKRINESRRERLRVRLPLLVSLGNSPIQALRAVTLRARMAASGREAERPPAGLLRPDGPEGEKNLDHGGIPRFSREKGRKICRFLPAGAALAQSVAWLRTEYLRRREQ